MQTKPDVEQMLMQSLKELVLVIPLEKITIKEITDKAQVIRPTFYNHFQDKYEVVERIIKDETLQPIRPLLQNDPDFYQSAKGEGILYKTGKNNRAEQL